MGHPDQVDLASAVSLVHPGSTVYIGNFGAQLHCVGHELVRQGLDDLHVVIGSGGILLDALIGTDVACRATFAHCWGPIGPAPAWNFRRAAEGGGGDRFNELSLGALYAALLGGAWGVPFMPIAVLDNTGYVTEAWSTGTASAASPFGDCAVVRSLVPDVAFVHVDVVDRLGNAVIDGPYGTAVVAAQAATRTIVVAEELCERIGDRAGVAAIPGALVSAFVVLPGAVRPDGTFGRYGRDIEAYRRYAEASRTEEGFAEWVDLEVRR